MVARWVALVAIVALSACGSDAASSTTPAGPLSCTSTKSSVTFTTALASCNDALTEGSTLAVRLGRSTVEGGELIFTSMCSIIQGSTKMTYHDALDLEFARELSSHGICPGDMSLLVHA